MVHLSVLKVACDSCKVEMAQTVNEISAMPNGKMTLGIYADNDIETFRDLIFYVAQVLGGFVRLTDTADLSSSIMRINLYGKYHR